MGKAEFVKPSKFFKTFLFYYIGIGILLWIFSEIFSLDSFITDKLVDIITIENTTVLYIIAQICTFIIAMCILVFIIWVSIKKTCDEKMVKSEEIKTLVKYFLILNIIFLVLNSILMFYIGRLQQMMIVEALAIPQTLITSMDISIDIIGLIISVFFFRKFLLDKVKNESDSFDINQKANL